MRDLIRKATFRRISSPIDAKEIPSTSRLISSPSDSADQSTTKPPLFQLSPKRTPRSFSPDQDPEYVLKALPNNEKAEPRSYDAQAGENRGEQKQQGDHGNRTETGCLQCRKQNKACDGIRPDCKRLSAYQMFLIFALQYYHTRYCSVDFEIGKNCVQGGFNCSYERTLDRWAQMRKNAAERAARRQSEGQSREGNNSQIIATDDDEETSGEESKNIRVVILLLMLIKMQPLRVVWLESKLELPSSPAI
jgi:hypothetical protein